MEINDYGDPIEKINVISDPICKDVFREVLIRMLTTFELILVIKKLGDQAGSGRYQSIGRG